MSDRFLVRSRRIRLTSLTEDDIPLLHAWFLSCPPELVTCRPIQRRPVREMVQRFREGVHPDVHSYAVRREEDDTLLGRITYFDLNMRNRSCEIGYLTSPEYRRLGYTSEAIQLLLSYLFKELELNKVMAQTAAFNEPSVALLRKLGFTQDGRLREHHEYDGRMLDDLIFSILASEFTTAQNMTIEIGG